MEEILHFNESVHRVTLSQQLEVPKNCNGYLAVNKGTTTVIVNGFPLLPPVAPALSGESTGLIGNRNELYHGNNNVMDINFPSGGGVVYIVFKYYLKVN